jgi:hypothetical protein
MRFSCGTVRSLSVAARMELSDIDFGGAIRFRVLVIEPESGQILGSAEGLRPAKSGESPDRQPLLTLRETNLGPELWRIDVDPRDGPVLSVNNLVLGLAAQIRNIPLLQGLVLPHEGDDLWGDGWRKFLRELGLPPEPEDRDPDSLEDWIDSAVEKFCQAKDFVSRVRTEPSIGGT